MAVCGNCGTHVRNDEIPMLRDRGKCTRCEMRRLEPRPTPALVRMTAEVPGHGVLIGVPSTGPQGTIDGAAGAPVARPHP